MTTTPCTGCAVQQGTHQPAEALHQIAEPKTQQREALRLADELGMWHCPPSHILDKAAAELRRQHARIVELEAQLAEVTHPTQQGMDVIAGAIALCKHAAKIQNIDFDDYWAIHSDEFKEEAKLVLDAAQAKQGGA